MARKKWTPRTDLDESALEFREKRKWQIALRRYVLEKNKSSYYAPYFGLDIEKFREWISLQFDEGLNWDNFSEAWQFEHIVPLSYFDFSNEEDLSLCWNFINIRIERTRTNGKTKRVDVLAAKSYFEALFESTGYAVCRKLVEKISRIEAAQIAGSLHLEKFITENKSYLELVAGFSSYELDKLNAGADISTVQYEKDFLKKFGG